jgi:hypothetical protein
MTSAGKLQFLTPIRGDHDCRHPHKKTRAEARAG